MELDKKMVEKIAELARLEVSAEEIDQVTQDMSKIVTFMEQLNTLDTDGVEPLIYVNEDRVNVLREDVVVHALSTNEILGNSALHNEAYFEVPKIIEK